MLKEVLVDYYEILYSHSHGETKENSENCQDIQFPANI
jgi:hypothetical protein